MTKRKEPFVQTRDDLLAGAREMVQEGYDRAVIAKVFGLEQEVVNRMRGKRKPLYQRIEDMNRNHKDVL